MRKSNVLEYDGRRMRLGRKLTFSLLLLLLSILLSMAIVAIILSWKYGNEFHSLLIQGRWPVSSYRYNADMQNFELVPSFSKRLLNGHFYLKTHSLGYRIPEQADQVDFRPGGLLAIGCSFTFGDSVEAEETFSYLAARKLGLDAYNFGVCSYSYASSIIQLEDLERRGVLKALRPSIIVLGTGSWMVERSLNTFYPSPEMQLAYPYISGQGGQASIVYPPDFISVRHAVGFATISSYFDGEEKDVPLTLRRRILLLDVIPRVLVAKAKRRFFKNEMSSYELYSFAVDRIAQVAERIGAQVVIMNMPVTPEQSKIDEGLQQAVDECACAILVDGHRELKERDALEAQLVHPGRRAHETYAEAIVKALRYNPAKKREE